MNTFDAIIIGTGQAGPFLAHRLATAGMNVAIIERKLFGGTCVNTGCIPTKTMVASAYAAHIARRAADFGVRAGSVNVDMKRVKARKDAISGNSRTGVETWLKKMEHCTVFQGHARFESPHEVSVGAARLAAERIFINVGGRASTPALAGIDRVPYLTNSTMMDVDTVPGHLVIVGGSYIGLEFAQMYRRFGSQVTVVERAPKLLPREDDDVAAEIRAVLEREGVEIRTSAECIAFERKGGLVDVDLTCEDGEPVSEGTHVLLAMGRVPNTDDLGLDAAGVKVDPRGYIEVDDECRTNVPGVWALGDVNGKGAFTHTSYNDYEIVAANVLDGGSRRISQRIACYGLFIDPPLGRAGMTEREARATGRRLLAGKVPMRNVGRARESGEMQGFMKVVVDADTKEILGAALLGLNGDEIVHSLLDAMYARAPYTTISNAVHIHPTVAEFIPTLLQDLKPLAP